MTPELPNSMKSSPSSALTASREPRTSGVSRHSSSSRSVLVKSTVIGSFLGPDDLLMISPQIAPRLDCIKTSAHQLFVERLGRHFPHFERILLPGGGRRRW